MKIKIDKDCCGCSLCVEACPCDALKMNSDENGFLYPKLNEDKCSHCGLCEKICPFNEKFTVNLNQAPHATYIARSRFDEVLAKSASGGLFTTLSDEILHRDGVVYGAVWDDTFVVRHVCGTDSRDRDKMCGSKYVQSDMQGVYSSVAADLTAQKDVFFTGTPCQVAAVYSYLNLKKIPLDHLYTCDIICHGVSSPKVFKKYLEFVKKNYGNEIEFINMRDKRYGSGYNMTIKTSQNEYHKPELVDPFIKIFTLNCAMRPSCNECYMKKPNRMGDITIGDFQKEREFFPEYDDKKGVSVVWINNEKGKRLFDDVLSDLDFKNCSVEQSMQHNLHSQIPASPIRDRFFDDLSKKDIEKVLKKYTEYGVINHMYGVLRRGAKKVIYTLLRKPL